MKKHIITTLMAAAAAIVLTQSAQAVPITGNMGFSGAAQLDSTSVQTATEVLSWSQNNVDATSGSFSSVALGSPVTLASPWMFNSGALANFWKVGGFTFNLLSSSIFSQNALFLNVVLAGTVSGNGFDATAFSGTFQVGNPSANGMTTFTERLSFSSVPDGGTTVLFLGVAMLGLALIKRQMTNSLV